MAFPPDTPRVGATRPPHGPRVRTTRFASWHWFVMRDLPRNTTRPVSRFHILSRFSAFDATPESSRYRDWIMRF
jgi:hypothetical protein